MTFSRISFLLTMSTTSSQHDSLRSTFAEVMSMSDDRLRGLFESKGESMTTADMRFIAEVSSYSGEQLSSVSHELLSLTHSLNRKLETEMLSADRSVEPCIDTIESIVMHDFSGVKSMLNSWDLACATPEMFKTFKAEKQMLRILLQNSQALQEFIEIPQLMEQCISSFQFAEALALHDFFHRVVLKFGLSSVGLVKSLSKEIESQKNCLTAAIDSALCAKALKVQEVNNLLLLHRVMFPRADLKAKFLEVRSQFYHSRKPRESENPPAKFIKDYVELIRVQLSEILNQFKMLFQQTADPDLSRFVIAEVNEFLQALERMLPRIPAETVFQAMAEIYQHASYIKHFQLNARINPVFHNLLVDRIDKQVGESIESFKTELSMYNWKPFLALIPDDGSPDAIIHLTRHKPLALLYNDATNLLNDLRVFPMVSVKNRITAALDQLMYSAFELLAHNPNALAVELGIATHNFCVIIVGSVEKTLSAVFQTTLRFSHIRSHPRFIQEAVPAAPHTSTHGSAETDEGDPGALVDEILDPIDAT